MSETYIQRGDDIQRGLGDFDTLSFARDEHGMPEVVGHKTLSESPDGRTVDMRSQIIDENEIIEGRGYDSLYTPTIARAMEIGPNDSEEVVELKNLTRQLMAERRDSRIADPETNNSGDTPIAYEWQPGKRATVLVGRELQTNWGVVAVDDSGRIIVNKKNGFQEVSRMEATAAELDGWKWDSLTDEERVSDQVEFEKRQAESAAASENTLVVASVDRQTVKEKLTSKKAKIIGGAILVAAVVVAILEHKTSGHSPTIEAHRASSVEHTNVPWNLDAIKQGLGLHALKDSDAHQHVANSLGGHADLASMRGGQSRVMHDHIESLSQRGSTIWADVNAHLTRRLGHAPKPEHLQLATERVLKYNGLDWDKARHLPVGYKFRIPSDL